MVIYIYHFSTTTTGGPHTVSIQLTLTDARQNIQKSLKERRKTIQIVRSLDSRSVRLYVDECMRVLVRGPSSADIIPQLSANRQRAKQEVRRVPRETAPAFIDHLNHSSVLGVLFFSYIPLIGHPRLAISRPLSIPAWPIVAELFSEMRDYSSASHLT